MLNTVTNVDRDSPVRRHVRAGDALVSINGHEIEDVLDYRYWSYEERLTLTIRRPDGSEHTVKVKRTQGRTSAWTLTSTSWTSPGDARTAASSALSTSSRVG